MCDVVPARGTGWRGWLDIPEPGSFRAAGPWVDLSHRLNPTMPRAAVFPVPRFTRLMCLPADPINVTVIEMAVHLGTHVDAPRHFFDDGPAFHDIPLARLHGPGVGWCLDLPPDSLIEVAHLRAARPLLRPGDILALDTGWARRSGSPEYDHHPSFSVAAAEWLVGQRIKLLACDFATPDLALHRRGHGFDWPVHHCLLGNGILVCEHLCALGTLAGRRLELMFNALNIEESDGAPARVLARLVEE